MSRFPPPPPPNTPHHPPTTVKPIDCISELSELYRESCAKHSAQPIETIVQHLDSLDDLTAAVRRPLLNLREHRLTAASCEALEEVLKRVSANICSENVGQLIG